MCCTVAASQVECVIGGAIMRAKTHVVLPSKILCYTLINWQFVHVYCQDVYNTIKVDAKVWFYFVDRKMLVPWNKKNENLKSFEMEGRKHLFFWTPWMIANRSSCQHCVHQTDRDIKIHQIWHRCCKHCLTIPGHRLMSACVCMMHVDKISGIIWELLLLHQSDMDDSSHWLYHFRIMFFLHFLSNLKSNHHN